MMDIASLGLEVRSDGVVVASDRLNKFGQDAARAERATNQLSNAFRTFAPLVGTLMAAFSARALRDYADGWSDMQSRVGAAVKSMEAAPALMERLVDVANASYSPLAQTVEVYGRNVAVLRDLGKGAVEAADFTEALNHALVTTATKGQDADVVLNALSRAISIGGLRAMEYETIMSRSPRVLEAVAKELGTTTTGLRALAQQGKVTGTVIVDGLVKSLSELRKEAGEMPATVGDALVRLDTNFGALVGRLDQATGASEGFAQTLIGLADAIRAGTDDIVRAALVIQTGFNAALEWASRGVTALAGDFDSAASMMIAGAGAAGFAVTALATAITGTLIRAVAALGVAMAANPFALFIAGVSAAVTALYLFRDEIAEIVGIDVFGAIKDTANDIMNAMIGAFRAVVAIWDQLPSQFDRIGKLAWNALMDGLSGDIITIDALGKQFSFGIDLSDFKNKLDDAESYAVGVATAAYHAEQGIDRIGQAAEALGETWRSVDVATASFDALATSASKAGQTIDEKAAKSAEKLAEAYRQIVDDGQNFVRQQQLEAGLIGMTEQAANALRYEFDLLNEARRAGITLTDSDRAGFRALAEAMAEAEENTRHLKEAFDFTKGTIMGFFSDLRSGLMEGKGFFEALGQAGLNAINKIADRLMDLALDQMINGFLKNLMGAFGGTMGGGLGLGGLGGGAFPSAPGAGLYQNGGWTGDGPVARAAGIVHGQEFVVKAGPAARFRPMLEAMNSGAAPASTGNQGSASNSNGLAANQAYAHQNVHVTVGVSVDRDGNLQAYVKNVSQREGQAAATAVVQQYDREVLADRVNQIANDPHARG